METLNAEFNQYKWPWFWLIFIVIVLLPFACISNEQLISKMWVSLLSLILILFFDLFRKYEIKKSIKKWKKEELIKIPFNEIIEWRKKNNNFEIFTLNGKYQFPSMNFYSDPKPFEESLKEFQPKIKFSKKYTFFDLLDFGIQISAVLFSIGAFLYHS